MEQNSSYQRYHRQLILQGFGIDAQQKLLHSRVLVVGAGGLGCPVLMNLTGMGVGMIGVVDDGLVELSNLHRQLLYDMGDIAELKTNAAKKKLQRMNPDIQVSTYPVRLTNHNATEILNNYDLIVDCTDNFPTRYMLTDACWLLKKQLVFGAVSRYEGQVSAFDNKTTYRDLFPDPPQEGEIADCNEAGVLGVLPNIIGNFMANECIKIITGIGETLKGKLLTYSALTNDSFTIEINSAKLSRNRIPETLELFRKMNYPALCGVEPSVTIDLVKFEQLLQQNNTLVIDVREPDELPELTIPHKRISLSELKNSIPEANQMIVFICQSGKRSLQAVNIFKEKQPSLCGKIFSLQNGINSIDKKYTTSSSK
ncbi:MAG: HesA/MoeB/ThiF family protein [Chitinophagaceae bacterium]|nr:HesA/MoeB/ThiF family protein [Chitinophagaceae bacterium]